MKVAMTMVVVAVLFSAVAVAVEPETRTIVRDHALGRVFMSSAERHRLDLLRKTVRPSEHSGPINAASQAATIPQKKKPNPVGYIFSSSGRPYQWIDGDFRRVTQTDIEGLNKSRNFGITRHKNEPAADDHTPDEDMNLSSERVEELDVEAGNENRSQQ